MRRVQKTVFISYRRTNGPWALAVYKELTHNGYDVFFDYTGLAAGDFERGIIENIRSRAHFLILLTPSALERCDQPGDWLRREIEEAMECGRNIVPLMLEGFDFGASKVAPKLTGKLEDLKRYNGVGVSIEYFDAAMGKLREQFLNIELDAVLKPASETTQETATSQKTAAADAPKVSDEQLTAQVWFERGYSATDLDEQIRCYTEVIRLDPNSARTHNNRGVAHNNKGDFEAAIVDLNEAIRLDPNLAETYSNRGNSHNNKGDFDAAITDYSEAIRLDPDYAMAYHNRGNSHSGKGDFEAAITDYTEGIRLDPNHAKAYNNRGAAHGKKGDLEAALADYTEAIRLDPNTAMAYYNRGVSHTEKGDVEAAIADYTEAIQLDPNYVDAYYNRGSSYCDKGDFEAAIADFNEALRLDPNNAMAYKNRGYTRAKNGDVDGLTGRWSI